MSLLFQIYVPVFLAVPMLPEVFLLLEPSFLLDDPDVAVSDITVPGELPLRDVLHEVHMLGAGFPPARGLQDGDTGGGVGEEGVGGRGGLPGGRSREGGEGGGGREAGRSGGRGV